MADMKKVYNDLIIINLYYVFSLALQKIFPGKDKNDTDIIVRISQD